MRIFLALISSPPPALGLFVMPAAVLVFSYLTFGALVPALGLQNEPLVLAVVTTIAFNALRSLPMQFRKQEAGPFVVRTVWVFVIATITVFLWFNHPLWCQRSVTIILAAKALFLTHAIWRAPEDLDRLGAPPTGPDWFRSEWARWKIVALGLTVLINETAIRFATQAEWIVVTAILPALVYCLFYWTLTVLAWDRLD